MNWKIKELENFKTKEINDIDLWYFLVNQIWYMINDTLINWHEGNWNTFLRVNFSKFYHKYKKNIFNALNINFR